MVELVAELLELEVDVATGADNLIDDDVITIVEEFPCTYLELLDVADSFLLGAFADGDDAVEEVVEFLAAGKVVLGDGAAEAALGGVGHDE